MARITSTKELQNIVVLGLDLWVAPPIELNTRLEAWCMKRPELTQGKQGLMLGNNLVARDYLPMWGVRDPDCTALLYIWDGNENRLYNTQQEAQNATNRRLVQS